MSRNNNVTGYRRRNRQRDAQRASIGSNTVSSLPPPVSKSVASRPTRATIFIVATVNPGAEAEETVRGLCADLSSLRSVGFRNLNGQLSCIMGFGSDAWDRLFGAPRPKDLHPFRETRGVLSRGSIRASTGDDDVVPYASNHEIVPPPAKIHLGFLGHIRIRRRPSRANGRNVETHKTPTQAPTAPPAPTGSTHNPERRPIKRRRRALLRKIQHRPPK